MAMTRRMSKHDYFIMNTIEELVPQDHLVRELEESLDWKFIYPKVENLYSPVGRPSIDPVILFKMIFINIVFGYNSMRKTCEEIKVNLAYRWFLGLSMEEKVPNYSTWSQNYIRRYGDSDIFEEIFKKILETIMNKGLLELESIHVDSTHRKANANKNKYESKEVEIKAREYDEELLKEINEQREYIGAKTYDSLEKEEIIFDEETGEETVVKSTKKIKSSTTDPESGAFHKGKKQECFAYSEQTFCDKHGYVINVTTVPGNIHDSVSFFYGYNEVIKKFGEKILNFVMDAAYKTPAICRRLVKDGKNFYAPYTRPKSKKGYFKKSDYVYDETYDQYICPNSKLLYYGTTNKQGYRVYKSDPKDCEGCPFLNKCTNSKNHQKVIMRHLWEEYVEQVEELRYTKEWHELYPKRKETIERVFADTKEKMTMRYTRVKGLKKNQHDVLMIFACHNLKKMCQFERKYTIKG